MITGTKYTIITGSGMPCSQLAIATRLPTSAKNSSSLQMGHAAWARLIQCGYYNRGIYLNYLTLYACLKDMKDFIMNKLNDTDSI